MLGGLVGINSFDRGSSGRTSRSSFAFNSTTKAIGNVIGHGNTEAGGFVGSNNGTITSALATGNVTGDGLTGGFVAFNQGNGTISGSTRARHRRRRRRGDRRLRRPQLAARSRTRTPTGNVMATTTNAVGGFVGENSGGTITFSTATGNVRADGGPAIGGFAGINDGQISNSSATGNVTVPPPPARRRQADLSVSMPAATCCA